MRDPAARRWTRTAAAALVGAAAAAGATTASAGGGPECHPDRFVVHEWGTFTSVMGAEGVALEGLTREEETLPQFVYSRSEVRDCPLRAQGWKGLEVPPERVTQKMETPVLYLHSARERRARVRVDFVKGLLTQWYPVTDLLGPPEGAYGAAPLDVSKVERSFLEWDVDVLPKGAKAPSQVPQAAADDPWTFAREVDASWLRTRPREAPRAGPVEAERYLFYRGLGNFAVPLRVTMHQDDAVVLWNDGDVAIQPAFLLTVRGDRGRVVVTQQIPADGAVKGDLSDDDEHWGPLDDVARKLEAWLAERLRKEGLFEDEARAMVRTWSRSWFRTEGTRVLWIVPRGAVEAILPLKVDPVPDETVRVLVGRTEVITLRKAAEVEAALRDWLSEDAATTQAAKARLDALGRLLEPHLRHAAATTKDPSVRSAAEKLLGAL